MEVVFLIAAVLIAGVCAIVGAVPDPLVMMRRVRRDREPRRFYLLICGYLLLGAVLSIDS